MIDQILNEDIDFLEDWRYSFGPIAQWWDLLSKEMTPLIFYHRLFLDLLLSKRYLDVIVPDKIIISIDRNQIDKKKKIEWKIIHVFGRNEKFLNDKILSENFFMVCVSWYTSE